MDEDGFCVVSRKKGRKKGCLSSASKGDHCQRSVISIKSDIDAHSLLIKIKQCVNDLQISSFYSEFKETWQIAYHEISTGLPQSNISVEHHMLEGLLNDTITEGICQTIQSNFHSTPEGDTKSPSERTDLNKESDKIFSMSEDEVKRRKQASARTLSLHHVTDSITNMDEATQSDIQCEKHARGQGENGKSTGIKRIGSLKDHSGEVSTESTNPKDRRVIQTVCYGLGNFSSCVTARFQLALLILLNSLVSPESCFLFDPNFTDVEKQVLEELGYSLINKNEEGKRQSSDPTLFFMPHCGKPLYNNLLWANWGRRLTNLIILGNSFNNFSERFTAKQLNEEVPYIHKIFPYHREFPVRNSFRFTDIFNDMAFQVFPENILQRAPSSLWVDTAEPSYDHMSSVEIITTSSMR